MKEVVFSLFLFIVFFTADVLNLDTDSNLPQSNEIINETYVYEELNDDYVYEPDPVQEEEIIYIDVEDYFEENQTEDSFYQDETETVEIPTPELNETEIPIVYMNQTETEVQLNETEIVEDLNESEIISDELNETLETELNETIEEELNETIIPELNETEIIEELNETIEEELNETIIPDLNETIPELNETINLNETIIPEINETEIIEDLNETIIPELNETEIIEELNETEIIENELNETLTEEYLLLPVDLLEQFDFSEFKLDSELTKKLKNKYIEITEDKEFKNVVSMNGKIIKLKKNVFDENNNTRLIGIFEDKKIKTYNLEKYNLSDILDEDVIELYVDLPVSVSLTEAKELTNVTYLHNNLSSKGEGVTVCLLDTGADMLHPNSIPGYDFINDDKYPDDDNGHGTLMFNFINSYAPESSIYVVKVLNENGEGYISDVIKGMDLCLEKAEQYNIKVISMSFGAGSYFEYCNAELLAQYVDNANDKGILVVASTGNGGSNTITFPSCISNVVSVASSTKEDKISSFSNVNWMVDLVVPGENILLDSIPQSGTSISAASLSGIFSSYYSFNSTINPTELENLFEEKGITITKLAKEYKRVDLTHTFNYTGLNETQDQGNETNVTLDDDTILKTQANDYNVQRGTVTMTTTSLEIPINAVNTSRSFIMITSRSAGNTPNINFITANFTNSTSIRLVRFSTTSTDVSWEVVESSLFTVERGGVAIASGTSSQIVSISQVNTSNSFIVFTSNMNSSTANQYMRGLFTGQFVNSTAINFTRAVTGTASRIEWQVIQFNGASVQAGTVAASTTPASVNINSVNLTNSFIISTFRPTDAQLNRGFSRVYFFNSTQIRAYRANNGGTSTVSYFVITHPDLTVQNGTSTYTSSTTATINSVQTNLTFTTSSASSGDPGGGTLSRVFSTRILTNSTQIAFQKGSNTGTNTVNWFVVTYGGDLILPNIVFVSPTPANDSVINVNNAYFNTTVNDSSGVANATLEWNGTNYTMSNSSLTNWYYNLTNILPGTYTYKAWACDFSSNCNFTETRTLTYNSTPPNLSNVFLNASSIFNSTNDNLTVTYNSSSLYYDLTNITSWYVNNTPIFFFIAPFEGGSNSTYTKDYSGNEAIINSSGVYTPIWNITGGHDGFGAYLFDGIQDTFFVNSPVSVPTNNFTFGAWVKPLSTHEVEVETNSLSDVGGVNGQRYVFFPSQSGAVNMGVGLSVGTNGISVYEHGDYYMPAIAVYNQSIGTGWSHVVVTYENRVAKIYLNGDLVHTGLTSQRNISYAPINIGAPVYGAFNGTIDDAFVSNRVLSPEQIKKLYDTWDVIVSNETEIYDIWKACVTANDGYKDSETLCSNLTIIPVCDVYVDDDYNSSTSGWQYNHFDDLQDGIDAAGEYCTVYIMNGTYYNNYTVPKPLNIIGESVENTLIDFNQTNTTGAILINSTSNVNITNLTIFNGYIVPDDDEVDQQVYAAILSYNSSSIIISNVLAYEINAGFAAIGGTNIDVSNLTVYDCGLGVGIQNGDVVSIYDVNISNCNAGFYIIDTDSENAIFENNTLSNNLAGVYFNSTNNTIIRNNIIENSEFYGVVFETDTGSYYNLIYNNNFTNNSIQAYDEFENYYNITKTLGTNIINGSYLGGNYWDDYMGVDTDADGLGDTLTPYNSSGNILTGGDYHPLVIPCLMLNDSSTYFNRVQNISGVYHVVQNTTMCTGTYNFDTNDYLLVISNNSIFLDCANSTFIGGSSGTFLYANYTYDFNVTNCFVKDYSVAFNYESINNSYFYNNHANDSGMGFELYNSTFVTVESSIFYNNSQKGINLNDSQINLSVSKSCGNFEYDIYSDSNESTGDYNRCDSFLNWSEMERRGCSLTCTEIWHRFSGKIEGNIILSDNTEPFYLWAWTDLSGGNIYAVNSDVDIDWTQIYALGRDTNLDVSSSDFEELDSKLSLPVAYDNINYTYSLDGSEAKFTENMTLKNNDVLYVPLANSTFLGLYKTGILWDASTAAGDEFTGSEDIAFVGKINHSDEGTYVDDISYEIMLPLNFDTYNNPVNEVYFYVELK